MRLPVRGGSITRRRRRRLRRCGERGLRRRGRERQRQDDVGAGADRAPPVRGHGVGSGELPWPRPAGAPRPCAAGHPRRRDRDGVPGSDDVPPPHALDRPADRGADPPAPRRPTGRRETACSGAPGRRSAARSRARPPRVSASVLGRHAPAGRDRDRTRSGAGAPHRRRADDGSRRHGAGRDHQAPRRPAARARPVRGAHHARPRRDVGDRRPNRRLLRRPSGGDRPARRVSSGTRGTRTRRLSSTPFPIPSSPPTIPSFRSPAHLRRPPRFPKGVPFTRAALIASRRARWSCRSSCTTVPARSPAPSTPSSARERPRDQTASRSPTSAATARGSRPSPAQASPSGRARSWDSSESPVAESRASPAPLWDWSHRLRARSGSRAARSYRSRAEPDPPT